MKLNEKLIKNDLTNRLEEVKDTINIYDKVNAIVESLNSNIPDKEWTDRINQQDMIGLIRGAKSESELVENVIKRLSRPNKVSEGITNFNSHNTTREEINKLQSELENKLRENEVYSEDVYLEKGDLTDLFLQISIHGDWKHDHLYADNLVDDFCKEHNLLVIKSDEEVTYENGSDSYSAIHQYAIDFNEDGKGEETLNIFRKMFARENLEESHQLNEGPGAGYTIKGSLTTLHNIKIEDKKNIKNYWGSTKTEITATADCEIESVNASSAYYGREIVEGAPIPCKFKVTFNFYTDEVKETNDEKIVGYLNNDFTFNTVIGAGWIHHKFDGEISGDYSDVEEQPYELDVTSFTFNVLNERVIEDIDRAVTGEDWIDEYIVYNDYGEELEYFDTEEEAIEYAKKNDEYYVQHKQNQFALMSDFESEDCVDDYNYGIVWCADDKEFEEKLNKTTTKFKPTPFKITESLSIKEGYDRVYVTLATNQGVTGEYVEFDTNEYTKDEYVNLLKDNADEIGLWGIYDSVTNTGPIGKIWEREDTAELEEGKSNSIPEKSKLKRALERFDSNYRYAQQGPWSIAHGGYNLVFEIYYDGLPIIQGIRSVWDTNTRVEIGVDEYGSGYQTMDVAKFICEVYPDCYIYSETEEDDYDDDRRSEMHWDYDEIFDEAYYDEKTGKVMPEWFYGVEGVEFIWNGDHNDPEVVYKDKVYNYYDLEDSLYTDFREQVEAGEIATDSDEEFEKFVNGNKELVYRTLDDLEPLDESFDKSYLNEEYGYYKDEEYCNDIADYLVYGNDNGYVYVPGAGGESVEWELTINDIESFECDTFYRSLLVDISYPVRDGHLSYMGLDELIDRDFIDRLNLDYLKKDMESLGYLEDFEEWLTTDEEEFEFWIDYDVNFDVDEYERLRDLAFAEDDEDDDEDDDDIDYDRRAVEKEYGLEDGELDGVSIRDAEELVGEEEGALDSFIIEEESLKEGFAEKLPKMTNNFTKQKGLINCNKGEQQKEVEDILKKHYKNVSVVSSKGGTVAIKYTNESLKEEAKVDYNKLLKNDYKDLDDAEIHFNVDKTTFEFDTEEDAKQAEEIIQRNHPNNTVYNHGFSIEIEEPLEEALKEDKLQDIENALDYDFEKLLPKTSFVSYAYREGEKLIINTTWRTTPRRVEKDRLDLVSWLNKNVGEDNYNLTYVSQESRDGGKEFSAKLELTLKEKTKTNESWGDYKEYDQKDGWTEDDIATHKATNWEERNWDELDAGDEYKGNVIIYRKGKEPETKEVTFHKFIRPNAIFPPYYRAIDFDDTDLVGSMYDGRKHNTYDVHDRYEDQATYDLLTDSYEKELAEGVKTFINDLKKDKYPKTFTHKNRFNYDIKQLRVDPQEKTYEIGNFTWTDPRYKTQNGKEFSRAIDTLKELGYTEKKLNEDTVKQGSSWVNKGKEGTHGKFKTKKEADAQRKAMFARGYTEELTESTESDLDFLAKDEQEAIDGYDKIINKTEQGNLKKQLKTIRDEEDAHLTYLNNAKTNPDLEYQDIHESKETKTAKQFAKDAGSGKFMVDSKSAETVKNILGSKKYDKFAKKGAKDSEKHPEKYQGGSVLAWEKMNEDDKENKDMKLQKTDMKSRLDSFVDNKLNERLITVKIDSDDLIEMLCDRVDFWVGQSLSNEEADLFKQMYEEYVEGGLFDDAQNFDVQVIVDNDVVNYCRIVTKGDEYYDECVEAYNNGEYEIDGYTIEQVNDEGDMFLIRYNG